MSIESTIVEIINSLKPRCAATNFAIIAGIVSPARASTALNGQRAFEVEDGLAHLSVARRLKELQDAVAPVPVDWAQTESIKAILAGIKAGTLNISVNQSLPVTAPEAQFHVFMGNQYFVRRSANPLGKIEITGSFQSSGAARVTKECGDKLVAALAAEGHRAQLVKSTSTTEDGACDNFSALWGEAEQVQR